MGERRIRPDLRNMDRYPGEHYPIEQRVVWGEEVGGVLITHGEGRRLRCGCTDDLTHPWPHGGATP